MHATLASVLVRHTAYTQAYSGVLTRDRRECAGARGCLRQTQHTGLVQMGLRGPIAWVDYNQTAGENIPCIGF